MLGFKHELSLKLRFKLYPALDKGIADRKGLDLAVSQDDLIHLIPGTVRIIAVDYLRDEPLLILKQLP